MDELPDDFVAALDRKMDTELYLRTLDGLVNDHQDTVHASRHGYRDLAAATLLLRGLQRYRARRSSFKDQAGYAYVGDYALMRLLACWHHETLRAGVEELFEFFLDLLSRTAYARENDLYRQALVLAQQGHDYSQMRLPNSIALAMVRQQ